MGMGQHPDMLPMTCEHARQRARKLPKLTRNKPLKDTITIPSKGFTVFRFKADNPGWWFLHCHYGKFTVKVNLLLIFSCLEWHMANGMALVVQVGESYQMVTPPLGFPKCNNFTPKLYRQYLAP